MFEIRHYVTATGKNIFADWFGSLGDPKTQARIAARIDRISAGNFGDSKPLRNGICELRINWGPGYRIYYAMMGRTCVLLLCAGDKRRQSADIERAIDYWNDFQKRTKKP